MKKLLTISIILCGLLFFAGASFAATDTNLLQPASTITYNEDLTVNGTGRFDSIYIGKQGVGGVTFFNGTIINATTGEGGSDNPVTIGDRLRVDGFIYGGPNMGNATDQALKIADTMLPGQTNINDIGSNNLRWRNLYLAGAFYGKDINLTGKLKVKDAEVAGIFNAKDLKLTGELAGNSAKFSGLLEAGNIAWTMEKDHLLSINASGCVGTFITNNVSYCQSTASAIDPVFRAYWPINIDDKAKIKSFSAKIYDNESRDVVCNLVKNSVSGTAPSAAVVIKSITTSGSPGWTTIKVEDIDETVDNDKNSYLIYCQNSGVGVPQTGDPHKINGFKIEYSKSAPD